MFVYSDFLQIGIISIIYISFLFAQRVVIPANYFSVRDVLYIQDVKKARLAIATRALIIFIIMLLFIWVFHWNNRDVQLGIIWGSFLNLWPSFYLYRLYLPGKSKEKWRYLFSLIVSFGMTIAICRSCALLIFPMLFEKLELFMFENSGVGIIATICSLVCSKTAMQIGREINDDPYLDDVTYRYDLHLTLRKMEFEKEFINDFANEIHKHSLECEIPEQLLTNILLVERVNRGTWVERFLERQICRFFPEYAIKKDFSIGMAQIKISTAHEVMKESKHILVHKLFDYDYSIKSCAQYIAYLFDQYWGDAEWQYYNNNIKGEDAIFMYIAQHYLCGDNVTQKKFMYVYMYAISTKVNIHDFGGGNG